MRLLVSAFRKDCTPQYNASATAYLLRWIGMCQLQYELCVGTYKGKKEISVQIHGFDTEEHAISFGRAMLAQFKQECALLVLDNVACTVTAEGVQPIGPVTFAVNQPDCDGYTQFMDGRYMYAKTYGPAANEHSQPDLKVVPLHVL